MMSVEIQSVNCSLVIHGVPLDDNLQNAHMIFSMISILWGCNWQLAIIIFLIPQMLSLYHKKVFYSSIQAWFLYYKIREISDSILPIQYIISYQVSLYHWYLYCIILYHYIQRYIIPLLLVYLRAFYLLSLW